MLDARPNDTPGLPVSAVVVSEIVHILLLNCGGFMALKWNSLSGFTLIFL